MNAKEGQRPTRFRVLATGGFLEKAVDVKPDAHGSESGGANGWVTADRTLGGIQGTRCPKTRLFSEYGALGCTASQEEKNLHAAQVKGRVREMEKSKTEKAGVWTGHPCGHGAHGTEAGPAGRRLLGGWC